MCIKLAIGWQHTITESRSSSSTSLSQRLGKNALELSAWQAKRLSTAASQCWLCFWAICCSCSRPRNKSQSSVCGRFVGQPAAIWRRGGAECGCERVRMLLDICLCEACKFKRRHTPNTHLPYPHIHICTSIYRQTVQCSLTNLDSSGMPRYMLNFPKLFSASSDCWPQHFWPAARHSPVSGPVSPQLLSVQHTYTV